MKPPALLLAALLSAAPAPAAQILGPGGEPFTVPVMDMKARRFHTTVAQRHDFSCGSAAVATLLTHHYRQPVGEDEVFAAMYAAGDRDKIRREGFSLLDMKRYLQAGGYQADGFRIGLDKLEKAGVPAVALIDNEGYKHFVVIKGVRGDRVLVGDPTLGTRTMTRARLEGMWNGIAFLIRNRKQSASFNRPDEWHGQPAAPLDQALTAADIGRTTVFLRGIDEF